MTKYMHDFYVKELERTKQLLKLVAKWIWFWRLRPKNVSFETCFLLETEESLDQRGLHIYNDRIKTFTQKLDEEELIKDIDEQIQDFDLNNDGFISYAEYRYAYER